MARMKAVPGPDIVLEDTDEDYDYENKVNSKKFLQDRRTIYLTTGSIITKEDTKEEAK